MAYARMGYPASMSCTRMCEPTNPEAPVTLIVQSVIVSRFFMLPDNREHCTHKYDRFARHCASRCSTDGRCLNRMSSLDERFSEFGQYLEQLRDQSTGDTRVKAQ